MMLIENYDMNEPLQSTTKNPHYYAHNYSDTGTLWHTLISQSLLYHVEQTEGGETTNLMITG